MKFDEWLFIDKSDLLPEATMTFHGATFKGTMERLVDWGWIRYLSICHTPVSKTILSRCPKLEWVMVRGTAYEKVDLAECRRRNVGVVEAIPTQQNCAKYLVDYAGSSPWLLYGYGHIGKWVPRLVDGCAWTMINSKTPRSVIEQQVRTADKILMSVSYRKGQRRPPVFGSRFFRMLKKDTLIVSVCRPALTDNAALLEAVLGGRVRKAVLDTPGKVLHKELLETGRVLDTHHTAWIHNMTKDDFFACLKTCALGVMTGEPMNVVLPRRQS